MKLNFDVDVPPRAYKGHGSFVKSMLADFMESGKECARIDGIEDKYKGVNAAFQSIKRVAHRHYPNEILVSVRAGNLYFIRKDKA